MTPISWNPSRHQWAKKQETPHHRVSKHRCVTTRTHSTLSPRILEQQHPPPTLHVVSYGQSNACALPQFVTWRGSLEGGVSPPPHPGSPLFKSLTLYVVTQIVRSRSRVIRSISCLETCSTWQTTFYWRQHPSAQFSCSWPRILWQVSGINWLNKAIPPVCETNYIHVGVNECFACNVS